MAQKPRKQRIINAMPLKRRHMRHAAYSLRHSRSNLRWGSQPSRALRGSTSDPKKRERRNFPIHLFLNSNQTGKKGEVIVLCPHRLRQKNI